MNESARPSGSLVQLGSASTTFGSPLPGTSNSFASQPASSPQCTIDADREKAPALLCKQGSDNGDHDNSPSGPRAQNNEDKLNRMQQQTNGLRSVVVSPYSTVEDSIFDRRIAFREGHNLSQCSIAANSVPPEVAAPTPREGGLSAEPCSPQHVILWHVHTHSLLPHLQRVGEKGFSRPA